MYLPFVETRTKKTRRQVVQFGGLNRTQDVREGELVDGYGISTREWPCLSQRLGRTYSEGPTINASVTDMLAGDELAVVCNGAFYYGGKYMATLMLQAKKMATVNTKLCIFPDKKYLDLTTKEMGNLEETVINTSLAQSVVRFTERSVMLQGPDTVLAEKEFYYEDTHGGPDPVTMFHFKVYEQKELVWDPASGWTLGVYVEKTVDQLQPGDCLMIKDAEDRKNWTPDYSDVSGYAKEYSRWGDFAQVCEGIAWQGGGSKQFIRIPLERRNAGTLNPVLDGKFLPGDRVTVSGCTDHEENNRETLVVEKVEGRTITFTLADGEGFTPGEETGSVTLCRKVPDLDFICEHENRLIGLSNKDKTIYISALGDPRNFYDYRGLSVSSAYIPVGSAGEFTGCISYGGNVLIFKEDQIIRLMGDYDGNYATYTDQVAGVQKGCEKSLVILNEVLYYKGRDGIYAYSGSTPRLISAALGDREYAYARAGTDGRRYYISMGWKEKEEWKYELLVYDTQTGLWMKEEDRWVYDFARQGGTLYMAYYDHDHDLSGLFAVNNGEEDRGKEKGEETETWPVRWEATFAPFDETVHERKYPSRLLLRLELADGAWVEAELSRDGGPFQHIWTGHGRGRGPTAVIPIRPGRCDRYQLRLKGEGKCLIRSMAREFSTGGVR